MKKFAAFFASLIAIVAGVLAVPTASADSYSGGLDNYLTGTLRDLVDATTYTVIDTGTDSGYTMLQYALYLISQPTIIVIFLVLGLLGYFIYWIWGKFRAGMRKVTSPISTSKKGVAKNM